MTDEMARSCVCRYEALRGGALGQPVVPELRGGLAVLLRRGLWAWMRVVSVEAASRQASHPSGASIRPGDLVDLLADLTVVSRIP